MAWYYWIMGIIIFLAQAYCWMRLGGRVAISQYEEALIRVGKLRL